MVKNVAADGSYLDLFFRVQNETRCDFEPAQLQPSKQPLSLEESNVSRRGRVAKKGSIETGELDRKVWIERGIEYCGVSGE